MGPGYAAVLAFSLCTGGEAVLLHFYSDACAPCQSVQPLVDQLLAAGHPIRKINVQREPALASQFKVTGVPCFVMLVGGQEVDRVVGATTEGRLKQMLARATPTQPPSRHPAQPPLREALEIATVPIPPVHAQAPFGAVPPNGAVPDKSQPSPLGTWAGNSAPPRLPPTSHPLETNLVATTVRLRIEDASGQSCGSGTLIDARQGEALILTCGHLFRESRGKGRIEVDLFGPTPAQGLPGRLIHYDSEEKDLGLLSIRVPGEVRVARVAPPGYRIAKGDRVLHVGCDSGGAPTVRAGHVTAVDKFLGPPNLAVSGVPVQGRSGGGLFSADGLLIGVCNAAVPTDNEGLYSALEAIHQELDAAELSFVYRGQPAQSGSAAVATAQPPSLPKRMPPPADLVSLTDLPQPAGAPPSGSVAPASPELPARLRPEEQAALEEIQRSQLEGAEVICIIRSRSDPQARSQIIVVDRVSPTFLQQLVPRVEPAQSTPVPARNDSPEPDWRPRWLQPGYSGS